MQPNRLIYFAGGNLQTLTETDEDGKEQKELEERQKEELINQALAIVDRMSPTLQKQQKKWTTREQLQNQPIEDLRGLIDHLQKSEAVGPEIELNFQMGRNLQQNPNTSEFVKKKIEGFFQKYDAGQTTEKENKDFSNFIKHASENLSERERNSNEFAALSNLLGIEPAVAKIEMDSGEGKKINGLISATEFTKLPTEVQGKYLAKLKAEHQRRAENYHPDIVAKNEELQKSDDIPKDYKTWLSDKATSETLKYKVDWVVTHIPELKNQEAQFELKTADRATQKAFAKKGEQMPTLKKFQELTRDERETELGKLDTEKAKYEQEFGVEKSTAEAADQTKVETGKTEMKDSAEAQEQTETNKLKKILEDLKVSALYQQTQKLSEQKIAKADDYATSQISNIANLRTQAQSGEGGGFFKNIGQMMGLGKSKEKEEALESKELREQNARVAASGEVMETKPNQEEFKKIVGITPDKEFKPGELERLAATFLSAKNPEDPREIKNALLANEEMRQLALRVAGLDAQKMAA